MKKMMFLLVCLIFVLAMSGCVSARETQNPKPRKAVICGEWEKLEQSQK